MYSFDEKMHNCEAVNDEPDLTWQERVDLVLITCDAKTHPGGLLLKFMCSPSCVIPLQQLRSVLVYIRERIVRADLPLGA